MTAYDRVTGKKRHEPLIDFEPSTTVVPDFRSLAKLGTQQIVLDITKHGPVLFL